MSKGRGIMFYAITSTNVERKIYQGFNSLGGGGSALNVIVFSYSKALISGV